jgi:two-component system phosphate regulon sensor histidine kinase PhoR
MKGMQGSSTGSKTAAVVMLIVFLQVLVVAILGLGAIARDRDEGRRQALAQADRDAQAALDETLSAAEADVQAALHDARGLRSYEDLERLRDGFHGHAALLLTVYQVDPQTRVVYWIDGEHRLYVPPAVRAEMMRREKESESLALPRDDPHKRSGLSEERQCEDFMFLLKEYPFRRHPDSGYPLTVGHARKFVEMTDYLANVRGAPGDFERLRQALLAALEVIYLHADRPDLAPRESDELKELEGYIEGVAVAQGAQHPEFRQVESFRESRLRLKRDFGLALELALEKVGDAPRVIALPDQLVGLIPDVYVQGQNRRHLVARLSREAARQIVEEHADPTLYRRLGIRLEVRPLDQGRAEGRIAHRDLQAAMGLPFRAELVRVAEPLVPGSGPAELFYWGIIALAGGGLGMGGFVLVRLYTREVRLARLKADFVSNLSHELKTPITSIAIFTEMFQDGKLTDPEDQREGYAILAQESERLQRIVARMLDLAKREARGATYDLASRDLNEPVREAVERFRRIQTEPGLQLDLDLAPAPLPVLMDVEAMNDVVTNLVTNSWKYRQGDAAHIRVRTTRRGRRAEIVVADDGIGIPRRERRRVFETFYRAEAYLHRTVSGTGLGLSLVRSIVRAHRGTIRIESGDGGKGTTFRLRFPLDRKAARARAPATLPVSTPSAKSEAQATP